MYNVQSRWANSYRCSLGSGALESAWRLLSTSSLITVILFYLAGEASAIRQFGGGVRIPAGACILDGVDESTFVGRPSGGLFLFDSSGPIDANLVCDVPVPEGALLRQFVMVGNASRGEIRGQLGSVRWNAPRQHSLLAEVRMNRSTGFEIPDQRQMKVVQNLPTSGNRAVRIDRANTYFIGADLRSDQPTSVEQPLEIFYFEIYWD